MKVCTSSLVPKSIADFTEVNMLYLDQPVQVGMSYNTLANVTNNLLTGEMIDLTDHARIPEQNATFLVGTYSGQNEKHTALGTENAAIAVWHFAQTWCTYPAYDLLANAHVTI